jgi:GEVED domain/Secretion system C-terminal sorting domain
MLRLFTTLCIVVSLVQTIGAQVNYTANERVTPYTGQFRPGMNMGYYPGWDNKQLADVSLGNPDIGQKGLGARSIRGGMAEQVLDYFGYNLLRTDFDHYKKLGGGEHVAIVGGPVTEAYRDKKMYCPNTPSPLFDNLYTPIWDGGANGTPYNDQNYYAAYLYRLVSAYKDDVRFWEVWNEPGLDYANLGWRDENYPGNWWQEGPKPCEYILAAPLYHYIRILRISWEIIKTVDPDGYVCLGSVGYQSMLNAILSNTDNPNQGDVSTDYPLTGGAYFDCIAYHSYPHFDGSTINIGANFYQRHSDAAADGVVAYRDYYQQILNRYGYDGGRFPKKEWIVTEINSPRKAHTFQYFAGKDAQINHLVKAFMLAKINKISQIHWFQLFDQRNDNEATFEFHQMGMYKKIEGKSPYEQELNDAGMAIKTVSDLVYDSEYDAAETASMQLPAAVRGYAFRRPNGSFVYAVWAKTTKDLSEEAAATYSFPASIAGDMIRYDWDWGHTGKTNTSNGLNITLDARPVFLVKANTVSCQVAINITNLACNNNNTPTNAADDTYSFTMTVNGKNIGSTWRATINGGSPISGQYGTPINLGPYRISSGNRIIRVTDGIAADCNAQQTVNAPESCSMGAPSGITPPNYTANERVKPYTGRFRPGINMGYYEPWNNQQLADVSVGNPALGEKGIGARSIRGGLYEEVLDKFGFSLVKPDFAHYKRLGAGENVAIVGGPAYNNRDYTQYCPGKPSALFANLYTPIWDGGANGTPYNDDNHYAAYLYKIATTYKDDVRFWEIWNEPGLDLRGDIGGIGWRDQQYPGNWWQEGPTPCDYILSAPLYHYIRTLRISWEIIKAVDPDAYVCLGSVGYQSMLNAILRNTDNPQNGDVASDFPLTGGAYFDCISFHSYPHFDGSTVNFGNNTFQRHSDRAAEGVVLYRDYYQQILDQYGYNGVRFPKKEWIVTEINSPRKAFTGEFFAGKDAQINHLMKAFVQGKINGIHQLHWYQLFDQKKESEANFEFHLMGLYKNNAGQKPYEQQINEVGIATKTMTDMIYNTDYDPEETAKMQVPSNIAGYAFKRSNGTHVYMLWAKTTVDKSEEALAFYSFPVSFGTQFMTRYNWDWGYTGQSSNVSIVDIRLDARPVFFTKSGNIDINDCKIEAVVASLDCNTNTTGADPDDDLYSFSLSVTGANTGEGWTASVDGRNVSGQYGSPLLFGPYAISSGGRTVTIRDNSTQNCRTEVTVLPPPPCSNDRNAVCRSVSDFPWHDWISEVQIGTFNNKSDKQPLSDFTAQTVDLIRGRTVPITLTAGFAWFTYDEAWKIWIDYNQNGKFEESTEVAFSALMPKVPDGTWNQSLNGAITIPSYALPGKTRMRISMKRGKTVASPCERIPFGEIEDYSVNIIVPGVSDLGGGASNRSSAAGLTGIQVYPNPAKARTVLDLATFMKQENVRLSLYNSLGQLVSDQVLDVVNDRYFSIDLKGLAVGPYMIRVQSSNGEVVSKQLIVTD